jgi:hypothetical protein
MSIAYPRLSGPIGGVHPVVLNRRMRDLSLVGLSALVPLLTAFAITLAMPHPNYRLVLGGLCGGLGIVALFLSRRYEVTIVVVALYLGLLDGPVKLGIGSGTVGSVARDVLIFAVSLGAVLRLVVKRERVRLPPLSGWVLAFVALVVLEAFNPKTLGILKVLGGFRQQLEWVPFFFFGYMLIRSKRRFRAMFLLLGTIALINGIVSTYQIRISPSRLASWGPGYATYVNGGKGFGETTTGAPTGLSGRTFSSGGEARVRPPALGSDEGFGGSVGVVALAGTLALIAVGRLRRRWVGPLLCAGALLAIATSLQRTQILGSVVALFGFALLTFSTDRRVLRPLKAILAVAGIVFALVVVLGSTNGQGTFSRYLSITPSNAGSTASKYREKTLLQIPSDITGAPFGVGLSTQGSAAGFGGKTKVEIEGHGVLAESQYNFVTLELGLPGLLFWIAFSAMLITRAVRGVRRISDIELRISLAAVFATFIAFTLTGLGGPTMTGAVFGPFFWFAAGIAAYWFAGPGRAAYQTVPAGAA